MEEDLKPIIINGVNISEWTDEEVRYQLKHYSPRTIRQIAFDLYKQLQAKEQERKELSKTLAEIKEYCTDMKKDHYWGMRIIRFAEQILQKVKEVKNAK